MFKRAQALLYFQLLIYLNIRTIFRKFLSLHGTCYALGYIFVEYRILSKISELYPKRVDRRQNV